MIVWAHFTGQAWAELFYWFFNSSLIATNRRYGIVIQMHQNHTPQQFVLIFAHLEAVFFITNLNNMIIAAVSINLKF